MVHKLVCCLVLFVYLFIWFTLFVYFVFVVLDNTPILLLVSINVISSRYISVFEFQTVNPQDSESDEDDLVSTRGGVRSSPNDTRNVAFFNRQRCILDPSTGHLSFPHKRPFDTDVAGEDQFCDTVRELCVIFHIYPSKGSSWRVGLLSGPVKSQYDTRVRDMRGFWGSLDLLEDDGKFKKEGTYEVDLRVDGEDEEERDRRGPEYELEEWTLKVSIAWESRVRETVRQIWNVRETDEERGKAAQDAMSTVVYHFRHGDDVQTGTRRGFLCPWCGRNYMDADGLTMHFRYSHSAFIFRRRKVGATLFIFICTERRKQSLSRF